MAQKATSIRLSVEAEKAEQYLKDQLSTGYNRTEVVNRAIIEEAKKRGWDDDV